jgi:hypothetical protein
MLLHTVPTGKVEGWVDPFHCLVCKCRCRDQTVPCVGPRQHRHSSNRMTVGLALLFWCVTADWAMQSPTSPFKPHKRLHDVEWGPISGYSYDKHLKVSVHQCCRACH